MCSRSSESIPLTDKPRDAKLLSRRILDTARKLFGECGIDAVSMHQIAKAAAIGQATLYRRYTNKGDLCMDLMKENFSQFQEIVNLELTQAAAERKTVLERLMIVLEHQISFILREADWLCVVQAAGTCDKMHFDVQESPPYLYLQGLYAGLLTEGIESGIIPAIDAEFTAYTIIASLNPQSIQFLQRNRRISSERIVKKYAEAFLLPLFGPVGRHTPPHGTFTDS